MKIHKTLPGGITIIDYDDSHAAAIADLFNKSRDDWGGDDEILTASSIIARHAVAGHLAVFVAMDGDTAVGYVNLEKYYADKNTLYINLLSVRPDYQGRGIGRELVLMAVHETMRLGFPRLDLHTWSGNTSAVPLYKKCGFFWETRPNAVHFVNFIPSVITSPLFADFFAHADWYADSTRSLEIVQDGQKLCGFELFEYRWESDGKQLRIGYERSGRSVRMIDTCDYFIELTVPEHEIAFGQKSACLFLVKNKGTAPLDLSITGRCEENITFDFAQAWQISPGDVVECPARFHIGEIDEPLNTFRVHPRLLAEVVINGHAIDFGLGICAKFPLIVDVVRECTVYVPGACVATHINIESSLAADAHLRFTIPKNDMLCTVDETFEVFVPKKGRACVKTTSTTLAIGYAELPTEFHITADGASFTYTAALNIINQGTNGIFAAENLTHHYAINGLWQLRLKKTGNNVTMSNIVNDVYFSSPWCGFAAPSLGMPFDNEFVTAKASIRTWADGGDVVMEATYTSERFPGLVVLQQMRLTAGGVFSRSSTVENRGQTTYDVHLRDAYGLELDVSTVFCLDGEITQNHDGLLPDGGDFFGLDAIDTDSLCENWIFEDAQNTLGFCWPPEYKPLVDGGDWAVFSIDAGKLAPGSTYSTGQFIVACGMFAHYNDFRNFATGQYCTEPKTPLRRVDVCINGGNPFLRKEPALCVFTSTREVEWEGTVHVSGPTISHTLELSNDEDGVAEPAECEFRFDDAATAPVYPLKIQMHMALYDKSYHRTLFFPTAADVQQKMDTGSYIINNGIITFAADPTFGPVCYSLKTNDTGHEWLFSQYPNNGPFAWWNPFFGGIRTFVSDMNSAAMQKEACTARFASANDNFGNLWHGICITLTICEYEKLKGAVVESYYMTQPGLPLLCTYFRLLNNTGRYLDIDMEIDSYLHISDDPEISAQCTDIRGRQYNLRNVGSGEITCDFEGCVKLEGSRAKKMYAFRDNKTTRHPNALDADNKHPALVEFGYNAIAADGGAYTSTPVFYVVTEVDIGQGGLDDLGGVSFCGCECTQMG